MDSRFAGLISVWCQYFPVREKIRRDGQRMSHPIPHDRTQKNTVRVGNWPLTKGRAFRTNKNELKDIIYGCKNRR